MGIIAGGKDDEQKRYKGVLNPSKATTGAKAQFALTNSTRP